MTLLHFAGKWKINGYTKGLHSVNVPEHIFSSTSMSHSHKINQTRIIRENIYSFSKDINNNTLLLLMSFGSLGDDLCNMKLGQEIWPKLM